MGAVRSVSRYRISLVTRLNSETSEMRHRFFKCIEPLLKHGAVLDSKAHDDHIVDNIHHGGFTPLHFAVYKKHLEAVNKLIDLGADVTLKTALGKTILDLANEGDNQELKKLIRNLPAFVR